MEIKKKANCRKEEDRNGRSGHLKKTNCKKEEYWTENWKFGTKTSGKRQRKIRQITKLRRMENTGEGEKGRNKIMKGNEDREVE